MKTLINGIQDDLSPVGISQLGTIVFDNVLFPSGSYIDLNNKKRAYDEVKLDSVALTVNLPKNIIKSRIAGRNGTIKEYISDDDFQINLTAIIAAKTLTAAQLAQVAAGLIPGVATGTGALAFTPTQEDTDLLRALSDLARIPDRVEVRSKILQNIFGITYVVVEECDWEKTTPDTWGVKMKMVSDFDIDFKDFG